MRLLIASTVCLVLVACVPPREGAPRPVREPAGANVERVYYDVVGASAGELLASLKERGRTATQTDSNFARTTWTVVWTGEWAPAEGDSLCATTSSVARLESKMALPRWRPSPGASGGLAHDWSRFVRNLTGHENGHLVTAVAAAKQVEEQLKLLRAHCGTMEAAAHAAIDSIVANFRAIDEEYDRRTSYGALQGAVWPPRTSPRLRIPGRDEAVRAPPNPAMPDNRRP
jgi:predicted secreted Zn-dependent protease